MSPTDLSALTAQILWAVFFSALVLGAIAERTHFCVMGAVADVVNFGDWRRARMWAVAAGLVVLGFNAMVAIGWLQADRTLYGGSRWQWGSALSGGLMFGFGMVLASGCGSRNLLRLGSGNLKALVVLLVMSLTAWMTLRGVTAVVRVETVDRLAMELPAPQDLPSLVGWLIGMPATSLAPWLGALAGGALLLAGVAPRVGRDLELLWGGLGIGLAVLAVWWVCGSLGHVPEHPETLEEVHLGTASRRAEALSFVAPLAHGLEWLVFYSDRAQRVTTGLAGVAGVFAGSLLVNLKQRSFRWAGFAGTGDLGRHVVGAVLMGVGGVTAMGCTIGQGLSGLATLGATSLLATVAIGVGARLGIGFLNWQLSRDDDAAA